MGEVNELFLDGSDVDDVEGELFDCLTFQTVKLSNVALFCFLFDHECTGNRIVPASIHAVNSQCYATLFRNMDYAKCGKFEQCALLAFKEYYYQPIIVILSGIHVTVYAILG